MKKIFSALFAVVLITASSAALAKDVAGNSALGKLYLQGKSGSCLVPPGTRIITGDTKPSDGNWHRVTQDPQGKNAVGFADLKNCISPCEC